MQMLYTVITNYLFRKKHVGYEDGEVSHYGYPGEVREKYGRRNKRCKMMRELYDTYLSRANGYETKFTMS